MIVLIPYSEGRPLVEVNHCHGKGRGHPCTGKTLSMTPAQAGTLHRLGQILGIEIGVSGGRTAKLTFDPTHTAALVDAVSNSQTDARFAALSVSTVTKDALLRKLGVQHQEAGPLTEDLTEILKHTSYYQGVYYFVRVDAEAVSAKTAVPSVVVRRPRGFAVQHSATGAFLGPVGHDRGTAQWWTS